MKTKNIFRFLAACLVSCTAAVALSGCSKTDDPFFTASADDAPRILNTDIPEGEGGQPGIIATIERTTNFTFGVVVTPKQYTTVEWFIDDELVHTGDSIDVPVLAGDHIVRIVATTTQGKSTYRICKLVVNPAEGDPALAADAKSRWLTMGTTTTIDCQGVSSVSRVFIGKQEATGVSYADGRLTFSVPVMTEGQYPVIIEADGQRWGCGLFTVSSEAYVDPGIKESVLWEGDTDINWGDANVFLPADAMAGVAAGATIRLEYDIIDAEYHAMRITNESWSADIVPQVDGFENEANPYEFTFTADHKTIASEGGMLITGFGYKLKRVVVVEGVAPAETTLWEGDTDINWGEANVLIATADMAAVPVGATICLYYSIIEADYHALRITTNWWGDNAEDQVVPQFDLTADTPNPYEFTYTEANKAIVDERDGMLIVGFGYKLTKVTFK